MRSGSESLRYQFFIRLLAILRVVKNMREPARKLDPYRAESAEDSAFGLERAHATIHVWSVVISLVQISVRVFRREGATLIR